MERRTAAALVLAVAFSTLALPARAQEARGATSSEVLRSMQIASVRVQHMLDSVRRTGDAERTSCVDARLSELHGTLRLALERSRAMQLASERGERERAERERALVGRLHDHARLIEREARACVDPEPEMASGRTRVVVTIEPNVPTDAVQDSARHDRRPAEAFAR